MKRELITAVMTNKKIYPPRAVKLALRENSP